MSHTDTRNDDQIKAEHLFSEFCVIANQMKRSSRPAAVFSALTTDEKIDFVNRELFPVYNDETGNEFRALVGTVLSK